MIICIINLAHPVHTGNDEKCIISCKKIRPAFQLSKVNIYLKENVLETWPEMHYQCQALKVDGL